MKRRTLDILFSVGGLGLAVLLVVAGAVLTSNSNFAKNYVTDQLSQQKITFKPVAELIDEEKQSECVVSTRASSSPRASRPSATPTSSSGCTSRTPTTPAA